MASLYRPPISDRVKLAVILRQLGEMWPELVMRNAIKSRTLGYTTRTKLDELAALLGVSASELRLDHNPALVNRRRRGEGKKTVYVPDANDPEYLIYRTRSDHDIKTRVRGDGAQLSDLAIVRKRKRKSRKMTKLKIKAVSGWLRPGGNAKRKWPTGQKLQSRGFR